MSIADDLSNLNPKPQGPKVPPKGFEPGYTLDPVSGVLTSIVTPPIPEINPADPSEWDKVLGPINQTLPSGYKLQLVAASFDPYAWTRDTKTIRIEDPQRPGETIETKAPATTAPAWRYRFAVIQAVEFIDLPNMYAAARTRPRKPVVARHDPRHTIVVFADPQFGKVGRRGGTPELHDRMQEKRELIAGTLKKRRPTSVALLDGGDGFEGFNSGGNPMFMNDLSLADQMDAYGTELMELVHVLYPYGPLSKLAVPSNHTAWRNGKQLLGKPGDDLGLYVHRQVDKEIRAAKLKNVTSVYPEPFDESVAYDAMGTVIGLVHGNQFGPGQAVNWWEKQTFGAQAIAKADILVTGHYHTFGAGVGGRNPHTERQRWWLGAPTVDNGSDWYRTTAGRDSDPGILVFDVTDNGFDMQSLTIL